MASHKRVTTGHILIGLLAVLVLAGIATGAYFLLRPTPPPQGLPPQGGAPGESPAETPGEGAGFSIVLSEGGSQPQAPASLPRPSTAPLSDEEVANLLARLPALESGAGDVLDFRLPEAPLPPPRPGETILQAFPPPPEAAGPEPVEAGPLQVLRYSPEGEIPIAPFVNVTFNQPMVPLTTLEALSEADVPVQVDPDLPGTWRWLGTKTLNFQYDSQLIDRMPMSTAYTVTVPAGTTSTTGGILAEAVQFSFRTPTVTLVDSYPYDDAVPLEPVFFARFDQRIDPGAVLETIQVQAEGTPVSIRLASGEEVAADERVSALAGRALEGRWMAFVAREPLPVDSAISVVIGPGTPSAEGPLRTETAQSFGFRTYAPLRIVDHGCSWWDGDCPPLTPFYIEFNNPIDPEAYREDMLRVEPEIPGASVNILGDTLTIQGATRGRTTYRVTVSAQIRDVFGQRLGADRVLTFKVGPSEPFLVGPDESLVTLDPTARRPVLSLYSMNYDRLDLQVYRVEPSDWPAFKTYLQEYQRTDQPPDPPGRLVRDEVLRLDAPADSLYEVGIDLSADMDGPFGHFVVIARPPRGLFEQERYWEHVQVWVQVTRIGLDAFVDHSEMVAWATALADGAPLAEIAVASASGPVAVTGADGVARFPIPAEGTPYLVARLGDDSALLPASTYMWSDGGWSRRGQTDSLRWYVIDDRAMYRPGEQVHLKGWIRRYGAGQRGDIGLVGETLTAVSYRVIDPQGNELGTGEAAVTPLGGFDLAFTIPENSNLGFATIELGANAYALDASRYSHSFQIQEFRRPEFEVQARNETTGPYFAGGSATVAVQASYYAGGALPNAEVNWAVSSTPTNYQPPNWPEFTFGIWQPWWWWYDEGPDGGSEYQSFSGLTDVTGSHYLEMDFAAARAERPFSVLAEASVMDVNRQAWAGATSLLVHPADLYVGMRSERYFVERGEPLEIDLIVTDLDGEPVAGRAIAASAARLEWKYLDGEWREVEADLQECSPRSEDEPVRCSFETELGGRYRITALVSDDLERTNKTQMTRWVSGGDLAPSREVELEEATLIPDKESYAPGDTAEVLVQSPFSPAEGLLTVSRSGLLYTERFKIEAGSHTLRIPIEATHIPNLHVQVDLVGATARTDDQGVPLEGVPDRPAYASGNLTLSIPPLERTLALELAPGATALEPGGETTLAVYLADASGSPVADAELAVIVVDESILALTDYALSDPLAVFYAQRPSDLGATYARSSIVLANPQNLAGTPTALPTQTAVFQEGVADALRSGAVEEPAEAAAPAPAMEMEMDEAKGMGGGAAAGETPILVRSDFNPLATFAPEAHTNARGEARVRIRVPDNLTRYRIMVVAVDPGGSRFGSAEANLTARLPLMVRPSAPRFLNFGDRFELPVVLQNQTDEPLEVQVVARAANTTLTGDAGLLVSVPANDRVEVRFPAAAESAGTARFQVAAASGAYADAASFDLPVFTPATSEAFATYGVLDEGAVAQPVAAPQDVFPQYGGLEIQTSSTALQALTDAVLYLVAYPYECSEQLASRVLGVAALRDVLTAFEAEGLPSAPEMEAAVTRDLERLAGLQNYDGGFPYWRRGQESIPFNTIHVAHALQRAKLKGYEVPQSMQEPVLYYLRDIESHYPYWYSQRTRWTLSAYALYVRDLMEEPDAPKARQLLAEAGLENLPLQATGWIWEVLVDDPNSAPELEAIRRHVANRVVETAGAANFTTAYDEQDYLLLSSDRRTDAVLLGALIADQPQSDLIPKLVEGLLAHRKRGRWGNTQENVFVLLALDRYFQAYEAQTPDFVARMWLGETYVGEHAYTGRTTERNASEVPMAYLVDPSLGGGGTQDLILSKQGPGRLYYRLGLRYAPTDLQLDPLDMGFVVTRIYEGVDDPEDVTRDAEGFWHIKAGARVRVRLSMVADNRRYHVALVDPLPAGLEVVNPALAVSGSVPQDPGSSDYRYGWWWWGTWYEHQNLRDERVEAFASLLWDGVYDYSYVARATTPGTFVVPPARAEEMYSPEVFGRSASDRVIVEDRE